MQSSSQNLSETFHLKILTRPTNNNKNRTGSESNFDEMHRQYSLKLT